jgi:hypothetical protein
MCNVAHMHAHTHTYNIETNKDDATNAMLCATFSLAAAPYWGAHVDN